MRRSLALPIAVLIGAASAAPISLAAASPSRTSLDAPGEATVEERFGIVRYDAGAHRWAIVSTPTFQGSGLTNASCSSSSGVLTVGFAPLTSIGTFTVDEDEAYAGRYDAGAAPTTHSLAITFRKAATGVVVPCTASELRISNSSLQLWVRGSLVSSPPPTSQSTGGPQPSTPPMPPASTPPTAQSPTGSDPTTIVAPTLITISPDPGDE
jgi:hypothetical protein